MSGFEAGRVTLHFLPGSRVASCLSLVILTLFSWAVQAGAPRRQAREYVCTWWRAAAETVLLGGKACVRMVVFYYLSLVLSGHFVSLNLSLQSVNEVTKVALRYT